MEFYALVLTALISGLAFLNWKHGLPLTLVMALLQDPLRKLTPDQPAYFNLLVGVVFAAALLGAYVHNPALRLDRIAERNSNLRLLIWAVLVVIVAQSLHSLVRFGSPLVTTVGFVNYFAPFLAILYIANLHRVGGFDDVRRFFKFYVMLAVPAILTVLLEQTGFSSPILGEVGVGIWITDLGTLLKANSGIFRASEIAAWHIFTCVSLIILLTSYQRPGLGKAALAAGLVIALIYIGTLTGRRKFLVMVAIFLVSYVSLLFWASQRHRLAAVLIGMIGLAFFLAFAADPFDAVSGRTQDIRSVSQADLYLMRSSGVFGEVSERFLGLGIAPISWAYNRTGFLGAGVGVGTQGVQHIGNFSDLVGGAAEGGLGRLMIELGAPGLLIVGLLFLTILVRLLKVVASPAFRSPAERRFFAGLFAFAISNAASYSIAQGMFGDIFVLLFNGVVFGTVLAFAREVQERRPVRPHNRGGFVGPGPNGRALSAIETQK